MTLFDQDNELAYPHIRALSHVNGIVQFFERSGYAINRHTFAAEELLNLRSGAKGVKLLHDAFAGQQIERIVHQDDGNGSFEVYLFELQQVNRKELWRQLLESFLYQENSNYLFVLARKSSHQNYYQLLNFLLVERDIPTYILNGQVYQQWSLPLVSTTLSAYGWPFLIKPGKPDDATLSLLRNFACTESNTERQHYKLLGIYNKEPTGLAGQDKVRFFNNRALFSNYYLLRRLPHEKEWEEQKDLRRAYHSIRVIYQKMREEAARKAIDVDFNHLFESMLQPLGFRIEAFSEKGASVYKLYHAHTVTSLAKRVVPSLIINTSDSQHAVESIWSNSSIRDRNSPVPVALRLPGMEIDREEKLLTHCLIYPWGSKLDSLDRQRDHLMNLDENPIAHVASLLNSQKVDWLIVTNGQLWRLYTSKAQGRISSYYEVNLAEITALPPSQGREAFRYFWLFFRAAAFQSRTLSLNGNGDKEWNQVQSSSFLDYLLKEGQQHAQAVEARLKDRVFKKIFLHFAGGFVAYARQHQLLPVNLADLPLEERNRQLVPFFRGTLTFLYRLLVLFYAEARNLLPADPDSKYHTYSLEAMRQRIARLLGWLESEASREYRCQRFYDSKTQLYDTLQSLFQIVDKGCPELNVPQYDGGLFMSMPEDADRTSEAEAARFLAKYKIPDTYLALGLDHMARDLDEELTQAQFAKEDKSTNKQFLAFIDYRDLGVRQLGSIYEGLLEFKLGIAGKEDILVTEDYEFSRQIGQPGQKSESPKRVYSSDRCTYLERDLHERKSTGSYYTPDHVVRYIVEQTLNPVLKRHFQTLRPDFKVIADMFDRKKRTIPEAEHEIYEEYQPLIQKFFNIHVLDPSMGSGHFLVAAVDYITDQIVKEMGEFEGNTYWHILSYELRLMRARILQVTKDQGIHITEDVLDTSTLLKRYVLKKCIYGVDSNPMAVELTKVSLWLHCFTPGAPFAFLNHHIKCGNSLLGVQLQTIQADLAQSFSAPVLSRVARSVENISRSLDITFDEALASRNEYRLVENLLALYKYLLNIQLRKYFGSEQPQGTVQTIAEIVLQGAVKQQTDEIQMNVINQIQTSAQTSHFFHWELEFPEIYFTDEMKKGFDAVVGNPPYDVLEKGKPGTDLSWFVNGLKNMPEYAFARGGKINLFRLFVARGIMLTTKYGYLGQIVPMSLLSDQDSTDLRRHLLENHTIVRMDAFSIKNRKDKRVFPDSELSTCIIIITNGLERSRKFEVIKHVGNSLIERSGKYEATPYDIEIFSKKSHAIPLVDSAVAFRLIKRLANDERFIADGKHPVTHQGEINETTMKYFLSDDPASGSEVIRGGNIQRYMFDHMRRQGDTKYIKEDEYKEYMKRSRGKRAMHTQRLRIGFQRGEAQNIWRRLLFAPLPTPPCYCLDTVSYFLIEEETDFFYLALFNSQLMEWLFSTTSSNNHISKREIAALPIRHINLVTTLFERDQIVATWNNYVDARQYNLILQEVARVLSQQPEAATDVVRDFLASLARRMVDLNQQKLSHRQKLFEFLSNELGLRPDADNKVNPTDIASLKDGGRLLEFAGNYLTNTPTLSFEKLWQTVQKNKRRFSFGDKAEQNVRFGYQKILFDARSTMHALEAMDRLINLVIYKLYDLTPEEINIVDGRNNMIESPMRE